MAVPPRGGEGAKHLPGGDACSIDHRSEDGEPPTPEARRTSEHQALPPTGAGRDMFQVAGVVAARPGPPRWPLRGPRPPPQPVALRVRVWRRLQQVGAVAIKNSVYALPLSDSAREDFQWIARELSAS